MTLLEISEVHKTHGRGASSVPAVRGVNLTVAAGETVGLVGESGCGKSSLGRMIAGLQEPTSGSILFGGNGLNETLHGRGRRLIQMVFQHPAASLNPKLTVEAMIAEPLRLLMGLSGDARDRHIDELLTGVGLDLSYRPRRASQLSGGQQQRVVLARSLACEPDLVVLDEPTASLDQSVRARVVGLLREIQNTRGVAYLFISHDLATVRRIADRVAVMYLGRIVELASTEQLFNQPTHPYTKALLSAEPQLDPASRRERIILTGETPNPSQLPTGCSFQDRCPLVHERCTKEAPALLPVSGNHLVECFAVQRD
ncbi:MAG TPA: oligopeptide/dipeptide ABC transporter ATP-binding protein [Candidatus Nanopelagicaceae bacterium]|nr:oligopeptide/dipeptide ABC transporter ATP-binding protein [Candidatus Nanopelagicaceae bacterium]